MAISTPPSSSVSAPVVSFSQLSCSVSLATLQAEVEALPDGLWVDHVNQGVYQGIWDVLPLRCQRQHADAHPVLQGFAIAEGNDWQDLPTLVSCPSVRRLLDSLRCPIKSVRLMRLKAGACIKPHRDEKLGLEYGEARLHLPIHTSIDVIFKVNGQNVPMNAGELWYINADQVHEVYNKGSDDRINLVIDCVANQWLCRYVRAGVDNA